MLTLQDLFFECANRAIKVKSKYEHFLNKDHPKVFKDLNHDFRVNPSKINIHQKTHNLLRFVTNRHVLQILNDVMFKFKKVLSKKDTILNQEINASISNDFLTEINAVMAESF